MSLATLLQTIIATIFIYLILSLLASEIQEYIASVAEFRAKRLKQSIEQLLGEDKKSLVEKTSTKESPTDQNKLLTNLLYDNYLISSLNQSATNLFSVLSNVLPSNDKNKKSKGPSYIEPKLFAQALLQTIQDNLKDEDKLKISDRIVEDDSDNNSSLDKKLNKIKCNTNAKEKLIKIAQELLLEEKEPNLDHFKAKLEELFKGVQERSSGVYKRNAKGLSFLLGLIIAILINADTFHIVTTLSQQSNNYSEQIVNVIEGNRKVFEPLKDTQDDLSEEQKEQIKEVLDEIDTLPLGWDLGDSDFISKQGGYDRVIFGWLISAIAIAMGAPFWFDLLSNIMNVRNTKKTKKNN